VYARLFGIGAGATNEAGALVNRELCRSSLAVPGGCAVRRDLSVTTRRHCSLDAGARTTAAMVLTNLAPRGLGITLLAARRSRIRCGGPVDSCAIRRSQSRRGARTMQQTINQIPWPGAPDVVPRTDPLRARRAGRAEWLATALAAHRGTNIDGPRAVLMTPDRRIAVTGSAVAPRLGVGVDTQRAAA